MFTVLVVLAVPVLRERPLRSLPLTTLSRLVISSPSLVRPSSKSILVCRKWFAIAVAAAVAEVGEVAVVVVAGTVAAAAVVVVVTLLPTRLLLETTDAGRRVASHVLCIPSRRKTFDDRTFYSKNTAFLQGYFVI
jgi:hypothetical protein